MKALLQRVTGAAVSVAGEVVGKIGRGLVIFIAVASGDTEKDAHYLIQKISEKKILENLTNDIFQIISKKRKKNKFKSKSLDNL